jgi:methionyl-tRNA formyltransferase
VKRYVVAGNRPWSQRTFDTTIRSFPGDWTFVANANELTAARLLEIRPRYVFFLQWSHRVPQEIASQYECVGFHMTDLPFGRGGSPLQNLIVNGHRHTKLTAFRLDEGIDTGPIYMKRDLSLHGRAEEIFARASTVAAEMIQEIIAQEPAPVPQSGEPTTFARRKPEQSRIPDGLDAGALFDFIRMLDADGYPHAFIEAGGMRYEFRQPSLTDGKVEAHVTIMPSGADKS